MIDDTLLLEIVDNQGWVFPLVYPLILDSKLAGDNIQLYLRMAQYINQDGLCLCQEPLTQDAELHHALISKKDVQGMPNPEIVHSSFNTVLLHHKCHQQIRRYQCLILLSSIFGFPNIQTWYQNTKSQMKARGFRNVESILEEQFLS